MGVDNRAIEDNCRAMARQTSSQINKTYRAKRAAKLQRLARLEAALREIAYLDTQPGHVGDIARQALDNTLPG